MTDTPRWAIYYADSDRATDAEATPYDAPARGVLAIAQEDDTVGRIILSGHDYYWWRPADSGPAAGAGWFGGDTFGLWDYLAQPGAKRVVFGRTVSNEQFDAAIERARTDDYLPAKSAEHGYREAAPRAADAGPAGGEPQ